MQIGTKVGCAAFAALICAGSAAAALPSPPDPPVVPALPALPAPLPQPPVELPPVPFLPVPAPPSPPSPPAPPVDAPATAPNAGFAVPAPVATSSGTADRPPSAADRQAANSTAMRPPEPSIRPGKVRRSGRGVAIGYALARSGRVFVILRGPVPRCSVVTRFSVRGERGSNALRFDGTVRRERLESGTYLIGLRTAGSNVRWRLVAVSDDAVRPVRRPAVPVVRACAESSALGVLVSSEVSGTPAARSGSPAPHASAAPRPSADPRSLAEDRRPLVLPFVGVEDAIGELPAVAGILLLLLLLSSVAGITAIVVRFLRAS